MQRRPSRTIEQRSPQTQRALRAREPKVFVDSYAERCGIVAMDELCNLYRTSFPSEYVDYDELRDAAAERPAGTFGSCGVWTHGGVEYALATALSNAAENERFFESMRAKADDNPFWYQHYQALLPQRIRALRRKREELLGQHRNLAPRLLSVDELAQGHLGFVRNASSMEGVVRELFVLMVCNPDASGEEPDRHALRDGAARVVEEILLEYPTPSDAATKNCAARLLCLTQAPESPEALECRGLPRELVRASSRILHELPRWTLNGWSANELRNGKTGKVAQLVA